MKLSYALLGIAGAICAGWVVLGRGLFGLLGEYAVLYAWLLGLPIFALHLLIARSIQRTKHLGFETRIGTKWTLGVAWLCFLILGFTIPDKAEGATHSVLTGDTPGLIGMAIGVSNPLGIIAIGLLVSSLICAIFDSKDSLYDEDAVIDSFDAL